MAKKPTIKRPPGKLTLALLNKAKGKRAAPETAAETEAKPEPKVLFGAAMPLPDFPSDGPTTLDAPKERLKKSRRMKPIGDVPTVADKLTAAEKKPEPKAAVMETLKVPAALLLAAESIAAKAPKDAGRLHGVLIHQVDEGRARVVARDGTRVFVGSFPVPAAPSWLKTGLYLARDNLKARVSMLTKVQEASVVSVTHADETNDAELSDTSRSAVMKVELKHPGNFPDYERLMSAASFSEMDREGEVNQRDWQAVGFSSKSLKYCGDVAKILEAGLDRKLPEGMVIRAFNGQEHAPKVFDYPQWPGVLLFVQPIPAGALALPAETGVILAPAVKLTVAALRAHAKRWLMKADAAEDATEKAGHMERAAGFNARVNELLARTPGVKEDVPMLEGTATEEAALPAPAGTDTVH